MVKFSVKYKYTGYGAVFLLFSGLKRIFEYLMYFKNGKSEKIGSVNGCGKIIKDVVLRNFLSNFFLL